MLKIFLSSLFCTVFLFSLFAQPTEFKGCHHYKSVDPVPGFSLMILDDTRSDSIDIINYKIDIDVTSAPNIVANTTVTANPKVANIDHILLDLLMLEIDSVFVDGESVEFEYDEFQCYIPFSELKQPGDVFDVQVYYHGLPQRDQSNFGGLVTESGYIYNLGIGIASNPHNFGRGWFPCFDNFMERSTFEYNVTHSGSLYAHCVGTELGIDDNEDGSKTTHYAMEQEITTYQSSIAIANYRVIWSEHESVDGSMIPIKLISKPQDTTNLKGAFGNLPQAIEAIEGWYGPYVWERVGFVATTVGAMEHPTNIAYPISSIQNGNADNNTRLMAHEFTHNWFGNLVTLTTERDMWIKEGPSEYGAHLVAEYIYGKEEFLDQVKDNHLDVLDNAHYDDDGFRALSGMPNEFTYGTHTYRKGASVIHNLRGYLGDSLFKVGMRSILQEYAYSHLDANQFRDQITVSTGVNMDDFFEAWIFNPGFSVFVEDSITSLNNGNGTWTNSLYIQQKLRATDVFHKSVPLVVHLYGYDGEVEEQEIMVSGQYDMATVETPFDVKRIVINQENVLNQSRVAENLYIEETGTNKFNRTGMRFEVNEMSEAFNARVEHIYASPDQNVIEGDFKITDGHYWRIIGDFPAEYSISTKFFYNGKNESKFDYDISGMSEDSVLLFYRHDASELWSPVADAVLNKVIPNDGKGSLKLENLIPGEYTIGKGVILDVNVDESEVIIDHLKVYPNPAQDQVFLYFDKPIQGGYDLTIYDINGRVIEEVSFSNVFAQSTYKEISTRTLNAGHYIVELVHSNSGKKTFKKLMIIK